MTKAISNTGHIEFDGEYATLVFERTLAHPITDVWTAISDPGELSQWFVTSARVDGRAGGNLEMVSLPMPIVWTGKILQWDPPHVFEYEFCTDPNPHMPQGERSVARWELRETEGGTLLTLRHGRLTRNTGIGFAPGVHAFLDRLAAYLAGEPLPDWQKRYGEVQPAYPRWTQS